MGFLLRDPVRSRLVTDWHDNEAFWAEMAPVLFGRPRWDAAPQEAEQIIELLGAQVGDALLDMPCGPGRHAIELARSGLRVTAVDRHQPYVEEAIARAEVESVEVEFLQADMRSFHRPGAFDAAMNYFTSFGYFDDPAAQRQVLSNYFTSLRSDGRFLIEMMGKEILARIFRPRVWHRIDDADGVLLEERTILDNWRRIRNHWTLFRAGERFDHELELRLYDASELIHLVETAGFTDADAFGSLDGAPYDDNAHRLIVVARKP